MDVSPKGIGREAGSHRRVHGQRGAQSTPAQIALAWLLAEKPWIVPIPGTTKMNRLEENIGSVAVELSPYVLIEIESAASKIKLQGERYSESAQKMIDR